MNGPDPFLASTDSAWYPDFAYSAASNSRARCSRVMSVMGLASFCGDTLLSSREPIRDSRQIARP